MYCLSSHVLHNNTFYNICDILNLNNASNDKNNYISDQNDLQNT